MPAKNHEKWRESYNMKKRATSNIREYMWDSSVKRRRVTQSMMAQLTVISHEDMNIYRL